MNSADQQRGDAIVIYGVADPATTFVHYVGKTSVGVALRLGDHKRAARRGSRLRFHRWLRNHMKDGGQVEIFAIETASLDAWADAEEFWIGYLRAIGCPLMNTAPGGEGINGFVLKPEHAKKIGDALRGRPKSPTHIAAWKAAMKFDSNTPEVRAKISASLTGVRKSSEHVAAVAARNRGRKRDAEFSKMLSELLRSPEINAKLRAARALRGPMTEETKAKISATKRAQSAAKHLSQ